MRARLLTLLLLLIPASSFATTVDFTTLTRDPVLAMTLSGITITGVDGSFVAIANGVGLGSVGIGGNGTIDYQFGQTVDRHDAGLSIAVDGLITALTVLPYLTVTGAIPAVLPTEFVLNYTPITGFPTQIDYVHLTPGVAQTISFPKTPALPSTLDTLNLYTGVGQGPYFSFALRDPSTVFTYGYSIQSLDYIPNQPVEGAPEPTTLALLAVGLLGLAAHRRNLSR